MTYVRFRPTTPTNKRQRARARSRALPSVESGCDVDMGIQFGLRFFFFKQKTAYEISEGDWSSDVCSSDLNRRTQDENPETCRKHKFRFLYAIRKAK